MRDVQMLQDIALHRGTAVAFAIPGGIYNLYTESGQTLQGSSSAVSKPPKKMFFFQGGGGIGAGSRPPSYPPSRRTTIHHMRIGPQRPHTYTRHLIDFNTPKIVIVWEKLLRSPKERLWRQKRHCGIAIFQNAKWNFSQTLSDLDFSEAICICIHL